MARAAARKLDAAFTQAAQGRDAALVLTQEEATAWAAWNAETYAVQSGAPAPLENIQIYFQAGVIRLYADHRTGALTARILISIVPAVAPDGGLDVQITTVQYGAFSPGEDALAAVNRAVRAQVEALWARLTPGRYRITALSVSDGVLTVQIDAR